MIRSTFNITVLESSEGKILTNGDIYSKKVYLGVTDSPDNWWEVDEEYAESNDVTDE